MDLPLLLSGFSGLLTAFVVGAVWATRRPTGNLNHGEVTTAMLEAPAHGADESSLRYRTPGSR